MTVQAALAAMKLLSPLRVVLCRCRVRGRARGGNAARGRARPGGVPYKCGGVVLGKTALEREIEKSHQKGARSTKHFLGENIRLLTTVTDRRAKNSRIAGGGRQSETAKTAVKTLQTRGTPLDFEGDGFP